MPKIEGGGTSKMSRKKNPDLVVMAFVVMVVFRQIFMRVLLKGTLAASGTEVICFAFMLALKLRGFDFNFHLTNGVNCSSHGILLFIKRVTFAGHGVAIVADLAADLNQFWKLCVLSNASSTGRQRSAIHIV